MTDDEIKEMKSIATLFLKILQEHEVPFQVGVAAMAHVIACATHEEKEMRDSALTFLNEYLENDA